jgi:tetratricopeptide (TPR) repeat protein
VTAVVAVAGLAWWVGRRPRPTAPAADIAAAAAAVEPRLGAQATLSSAVVRAMVSANAAAARGTPADLAEARAAFEQAVKLDERYAPAHAGLAQALVLLADASAERPSAVLPKAIEHGDLAVELDPAGALGWQALARAEVLWTRDWSRAEMHFRRAMALDPKAEATAGQLAELLAALGRTTEAIEQSRAALALNPKSPFLLASSGIVLYCAGDYAAALERFREALLAGAAKTRISPWLVRTQVALGATDEALETAQNAAAGQPPSWAIGYVHAVAGRQREAEEVLAAMGTQAARGYVPALEFAYVRAGMNQREEALGFASTAVREHSRGSELLRVDPIFSALRSEPAFQAALTELKLGRSQ